LLIRRFEARAFVERFSVFVFTIFVEAMAEEEAVSVRVEAAKVFRSFDHDQSGKIETRELKIVMQHLEPEYWTDERVDILLQELDVDGDNKIGFEEFLSWVLGEQDLEALAGAVSAAQEEGGGFDQPLQPAEEAPAEEAPAEEAPTLAEETPALAEETPALAGETPAIAEEAPAPAEESPVVGEEAPGQAVPSEEIQASTEDNPAAADEKTAESSPPEETTPAAAESPAPAPAEEAPAPAEPAPPKTFQITLISATGLHNLDWFGKSDPYCVCFIKGSEEKKRTEVIDNNLNPEWNETFEFPYTKGAQLVLDVRDCDDFVKDEMLGMVEVDLDAHCPGGYEGIFQLDHPEKKGKDGSIKVKLSFS
jgi:chemotaxis protein histidine kinase CheA